MEKSLREYNIYDKQPTIKVSGKLISGYEETIKELNLAGCTHKTLVMDCYVIADKDEIIESFGRCFDNIL